MKLWYALVGPYYDTWDDGYFDLKTAYERLMSDPERDSIVVINDDTKVALKEYFKGDLDYLLSEDEE